MRSDDDHKLNCKVFAEFRAQRQFQPFKDPKRRNYQSAVCDERSDATRLPSAKIEQFGLLHMTDFTPHHFHGGWKNVMPHTSGFSKSSMRDS